MAKKEKNRTAWDDYYELTDDQTDRCDCDEDCGEDCKCRNVEPKR